MAVQRVPREGLSEKVIALNADATVASTAFVDIGNLNFEVAAGGEYYWEAILSVVPGATSVGIGIGVTTPGTPTLNTCLLVADTGISNQPSIRAGQGDDDSNTVMSASENTVSGMLIVKGILRAATATVNNGTLQLRMALEIGTATYTVKQGSILKFRRTN